MNSRNVTAIGTNCRIAGYLHSIDVSADKVLVFQLPRETHDLSANYVNGVMESVRDALPENQPIVIIGCDVNIYEITGADATALKLKGMW